MTDLGLGKALLQRVQREVRVPQTVMATVLEYFDPDVYPLPLALVLVDGNPTDHPSTIPVATGTPLVAGQRVVVQFNPPMGALIIGTIALDPNGGHKPYATRVIAASNSIAPGAHLADAVCDGTDDHEEIVAMVEELSSSAVGGLVLLLEGDYDIAAGNIVSPDQVTIRGVSEFGVRLAVGGSGAVFEFQGGSVENMSVSMPRSEGDLVLHIGSGVMEDVTVEGTGGGG